MILVYVITEQQAAQLEGREHTGGFYSPFQNNTPERHWCISQEEIDQTYEPDLMWLKELSVTEEYVPPTWPPIT